MRPVWLLLLLLAACSPSPQSLSARVSFYVRNLDDEQAVLTLQPQTDPRTVVSFGPLGDKTSLGGGCFTMPIGSTVWLVDDEGGDGDGQLKQRAFTVMPADMAGGPAVWAEVRPGWTLATSQGVPGWGVGDIQG